MNAPHKNHLMKLHLGGHLSWYDPQHRAWHDIPLAEPARLADILRELNLPIGEISICAVNGRIVDVEEACVADTDRVELFPPIGGGAMTEPLTNIPPLDIEQPDALAAYLRHRQLIDEDETPEISVLTGGVSNRTVLVRRSNGDAWVLKQALPKLRVQVDWFSDPQRVHREALGLRWLSELAPPHSTVPLLFEDPVNHILGMQAVPAPHTNWKTLLLSGDVQTNHIHQFAGLLASIHRRSTARADELEELFRDQRFFKSLRLEPYYAYTASQVNSSAPFYQALLIESETLRLALVHGDYSPKNILIHHDRLILLDHEVIHWGDPAFDLGFSLTHLLSKAHHLPHKRATFAHAALEYWRAYRAALGAVHWADELEPRAVRHTLGCLLARVAGRSPLEYLSSTERTRQRDCVIALMHAPPLSIESLVAAFLNAL